MIEGFSTYFKIKQRTVLVLQKKSQYFKKSDHDFIHQNMNNRLTLICYKLFMEHLLDISFSRYLVEVNSYDSTGKLRVFGIYDQAGYPLYIGTIQWDFGTLECVRLLLNFYSRGNFVRGIDCAYQNFKK